MARYEEREDSYDLLNQYLHEIAQVPRLTPERERELGKRVQENDKAALEELVKANLRFVVSYAKKYRNSHVLFLDLINEGNIGLIHAAKKFDPDKNVKFITYAVWWIRQSILHALSEQGGAFRLPPKRANLMYRLEKAIAAAMTEGKHIPTPDELAAELGVTLKEVQTLLQANSDNFSLNAELDDESHTELAEMIEQTSVPSVEDAMQVQGRREELLAHMSELSPKERLVLSLRHGVTDNVPKRLDELASFLNREREQVAAILHTAINKVCDLLAITRSELAQLLLYTNPNSKAWWRFWYELGDLPDGMTPQIDHGRIPFLESLKQQGGVQKAVEALPIEEKTILKLRYGVLQDEELTLRDIGEILSLSRERVRQIESRAEAKCRRSVRRR
ncbi:MAG: polymerase primary sigma factor [Thermoanaerobaculia bacterium]|jgi:RNA polymerase primary sigma factor|nr:polymerase primary sigma factor [Thermoanaerobaculia bacterium]